ncbi:hypothetical protein Q3H58_005061 [Pseudomonas psychrotolerans]|nr:hypothetical protein [Pseudomonas psychrotolerans]
MDYLLQLAADPTVWIALATLIVMEVVLGIDNLIFISILTNKLPAHQQQKARRLGIGLALVMRLGLLGTVAWIVQLTEPIIELFGKGFSWKDIILIAGGLFLLWKATKEIHHNVDPEPDSALTKGGEVATLAFGSAIVQILLLDLVFSVDSIITAVGMTEHLAGDGDRRGGGGDRHVAGGQSPGQLHQPQPHRRDAGVGFPDHDRHDADRRGFWRPCAQGLHLCGHGLLGADRRPEHAVATRQAAPAGGGQVKAGRAGKGFVTFRHVYC